MTAVWWLEWRLALADRRRLVLSVLAPLLIVASVATGLVAPEVAPAALLLVFVGFAVLGSSLSLRWDGERGLVDRVVRGGVPAGHYLLSRAGAGASVDLAQLTPALVVASVVAGASASTWVTAFLTLGLSMWSAGLVGIVVAALARSLAETALLAAVAVLLLAHGSGAFVDPPVGSALAAIESASPFRMLHESLLQLTTGAPVTGMGAALVWALLLPLAVGLLGAGVVAELGRVARGGLEGV